MGVGLFVDGVRSCFQRLSTSTSTSTSNFSTTNHLSSRNSVFNHHNQHHQHQYQHHFFDPSSLPLLNLPPRRFSFHLPHMDPHKKNNLESDFFTEYGEASRYQVQEVIGKGSYGVVGSAIDTHNGEKVAIKKINDVF